MIHLASVAYRGVSRRKPVGGASAAALLVCAGLLAAPAGAGPLTGSLDQFTVIKNGNVYLNDTFSDGIVPPSGEGTFGTGSTPVTYFTQGGFNETGGKLIMDSEGRGAPLVTTLVNANTGATIFSPTELQRIHTGRALSNTQPVTTSTNGLKNDDTFAVMGLFDLANLPPEGADNFGIGLVDNTGSSGPTADRLRLSVLRGTQSGNLRVNFWRNNQTTNPAQNEIFGSDAFQGGHDQILLRLSRDSAGSDLITASYAYVDGANVGMDISNAANLAGLTFNTISTTNPAINPSGFTPDIFNGETHTRAEFRQLARDADNRFDFARLTTASPVSLSQTVNTGVSPSYLTFNYRFETTTGQLKVILGGTELGTIDPPPGGVSTSFDTASFLIDGALLNQTLLLTFLFDGPTGSQILLDSISFQNLQNGNFASGDLSGWTVDTSSGGDAGVLTIVAVPEPGSAGLLLAIGIAGIGALRRRRKSAGTA